MLNYKPSIGQRNGNDTPVSVRDDGTLYGSSIGGTIVPTLLKPTFPNNPVNTNLTNTSTWFYKQFTDYNFINGQEYYRVVYVGVDPKSDENEIIGTISASITNDFESSDPEIQELIDNSVDVQIWSEGKFNFASSVNNNGGIVLEDEIDSTGIISPLAIWTDSVAINATLIPGEYYKIWIKITCEENESLLDYDGYSYFIRVGDLEIPVPKEIGRLNISSLYSVNLNDVSDIDYILKEKIPKSLDLKEILHVSQKSEYMNIFYFNDDDQLNVLSIKTNLDVTKNKYINANLYSITGTIKESQDFTYTNFSKCITMGSTGTSGTSGTGTSGTSGTGTSGTSGYPITEVIDGLLNSKFIVDIHASDKEDFNVFYILYNEFVTTSDSNYVDRYGHKQYNWNTGVIKVDIRNINEVLFDSVEEGDTFNFSLTDSTAVYPLQYEHYWNSSVFIDDLFIISGFDVEDCRTINNRCFLTYIWEKDIALNNPGFQKTQIPESNRNRLVTVPNQSNSAAYLEFSDIDDIDTNDTFVERSVRILDNGVKYVKMGPPHRHAVDHKFGSVTYDVPLELDSFSATWSFGITDDCSCILETPSATGTSGTSGTGTSGTSGTGTSGTSGVGTSGTTGSSGNPLGSSDISTTPYFLHLLYQKDYNNYLLNPYSLDSPISREFKDTYITIFKVNCNGNTENSALTVEYNFRENIWRLTVEDIEQNWVRQFVKNGPKISLDFDNVFTINSWRKQIYGCGRKYLMSFNLYFNGVSLYDGITYTETTTDTFVITHNSDHEFSGHISFFEVRDGLLLEGNKYATTMFQVLSSIAWAEKETEVKNENGPSGLEFFSFRSNFILNNLNWDNDDDFIFPIVLQGNSYNLSGDYNFEVARTVFDFNKIDVNNPSLSFAYEGSSNTLDWKAEKYDFNNDIMVVWVNMKDWNGQRLTMYYGDIRVIRDQSINKIYDGYHGFWTMESFRSQPQVRFLSNQIYNGGEAIVVATNKNGTFTLQLDKQYFNGNVNLYKSNNFDIVYDDRFVHRNREGLVNDFITESVSYFKPGSMTLRNIKSKYPIKIESDGVGG